jgi:hypothetical protein
MNLKTSDTPETDAVKFAIPGISGDTGFDGPPKMFVATSHAERLEHSRNQWKSCADELVKALILIPTGHEALHVGSTSCPQCNKTKALAHYNELKGRL